MIINIIIKIINLKNNSFQNTTSKTLDKNKIMIPFFIIILITLIICGVDYSKYVVERRGQLNTYNNVKKKEIKKMASFLNEKYNISIKESDCVYYREQDYTRHSDIFGNGAAYNIPYITVFEYNNELITAVDRKGLISDNKQLEELNDIFINYFYQKTGIMFGYIEFKKSYNGSWSGNDNIINTVLQTKFSSLINDDNMERFLNILLQESDLSITFYIKDDSKSNIETLKSKIMDELEYLRDYENIEILKVYEYKDQLDIKHKKIEFPKEQKNYGNSSEDYYDGYKFGCYYVDSQSNNFTFLLQMDLDRGYSVVDGEIINNWRYKKL